MLLAPLRYWRVHHPVKFVWDLVIPSLGAVALTFLLVTWPHTVGIYVANGYLAGLQQLYAILGGFFVAALTLLSTADTKALSQPLSGHPKVTFGRETAPLERRRFLCLLFGYLAFSCFALYAAGFFAMLLAPGMREMVSDGWRMALSAAFLFFYNFWLSHMVVSTLVGLYYFTDRLQRPDTHIERRKLNDVPAE